MHSDHSEGPWRRAVVGLVVTIWIAFTGVGVGGVLVNLDATVQPEGPLAVWPNTGTDPGNFTASEVVPSVTTVENVKGVTFNGTDHYYTGPEASFYLAGDGERSIEAWVYNPQLADEETIFAWGRRGGPDGSNMSFNHGLNASYGAVGHWGAADLGWEGNVAAGRWTYVVYTYDPFIYTAAVYMDGELANERDIGLLSTHEYDTANVLLPYRVASQNDDNGQPTAGLRGSMTIARIRVHDEALSATAIANQFAAEAPGFGISDTDGDGLPNWYENLYEFLDPTSPSDAGLDEDEDGLSNLREFELGTVPNLADTDEDGVDDGAEVNRMSGGVAAPTDPLKADTDLDDLPDGVETDTGVFVSDQDAGSDPLMADSDADGYSDGHEVIRGSNPNQGGSVPVPGGEALVLLDATGLEVGLLTEWTNHGVLGGSFISGNSVPQVSVVQGITGVTLNGNGQYYTGPAAPVFITGNGAHSVEAWVHNPAAADEETVFSWGRRGGPEGSNMSFNHGLNAAYGAVGHWGAPDMGWEGTAKENQWTYLAYTYDPVNYVGSLYADGEFVIDEQYVASLGIWAVNSTPAAGRLPFRVGAQTTAAGGVENALWGSLTIARLRVHDSTLTEAEITSRFEAEADEFGAVDYDNDGLPTWYERQYEFLNERNAGDATLDYDADGLNNLGEFEQRTAPDNPDTDGDLALDGKEVNQISTHPLVPDTDQDGLLDGVETGTGVYVGRQDTGSDPLAADSDFDTYADGQEVARGSDPNSGGSLPNLQPRVKYVDLDATALPLGPLAEWPNQGFLGGTFAAEGPVAEVGVVLGAKGVTLDGVEQFYTGPVSPVFFTGDQSRTIDAWIYNPEVADEETIFAWGRRGGPDNTSMSFNHGRNATWGAVGHWGSTDIGWNGKEVAGKWTYVVYAYDQATATGRVYSDGELATEEVHVGTPLATWDRDDSLEQRPLLFRLGAQNESVGTPTAALRGSMTYARLRLYDAALTSTEVAATYASEKAEFESLAIEGVQLDAVAGTITFSWGLASGATYAVEATGAIGDAWIPVATGLTEPSFIEDIDLEVTGRFYRVRVE